MKKAKTFVALSTALAILAAPSLFADKRPRHATKHGRYESRYATVEGRIRDIDRDRNGFVIRLDNHNAVLFAPKKVRVTEPAAYRRSRRSSVRSLERGDYIRVAGTVHSRGYVNVDNITLLRSEDRYRDRNDAYISGVVERVDQRGRVVFIEDARTRRVIAVDVRRVDRNDRRYDVDDLRRGDRITVRGDWMRTGRFEAESLEVDRGSWW